MIVVRVAGLWLFLVLAAPLAFVMLYARVAWVLSDMKWHEWFPEGKPRKEPKA